MANETEIKLSLSTRTAGQLAKHAMLAGIESHRQLLINTYYDTPDKRLRHERIVVRHRQKGRQCLLTVKTAPGLAGGLAQRSEWEVPSRRGEFDFSQVDNRSVRDLLEAICDELQPAFTTHFWRNTWLLEPRAGVRIELALDRGWIDARDRRETIREVELELLAGQVSDLFTAVSELQARLLLHPEACSKSERAYRLLADAPAGATKALACASEATMPTIAAFRLLALACVNHLQSNEKGVCESSDPEFVHQARVAIRRLRSAIRLWQPLLPESFVARFDPLWQELGTRLGDTRNWDVFHAETLPALAEAFPDRAEIERLSRYAHSHGDRCRRASRRVLRSADYSRLLIDFTAALVDLPEEGHGQLTEFVPRCLNKRARRVNERAADVLGADEEARHRLRVAFKQLRYALDFFAPLLAGPLLPDYHQSATGLQELLGRLNDLAVAGELAAAALPGRQGADIRRWLDVQTESSLPEFGRRLTEFQQQPVPWKAPETGRAR